MRDLEPAPKNVCEHCGGDGDVMEPIGPLGTPFPATCDHCNGTGIKPAKDSKALRTQPPHAGNDGGGR